jgi:hypothetical protein
VAKHNPVKSNAVGSRHSCGKSGQTIGCLEGERTQGVSIPDVVNWERDSRVCQVGVCGGFFVCLFVCF